MPQALTFADIIMSLETAKAALDEAGQLRQLRDDLSGADMAYVQIAELCESIELAVSGLHHTARNKQRELRKRPRTEREMINVIVKEIAPMRKIKPSTKEIMSGGIRAAALRQADGRCELCGNEWDLSTHHVVPRARGGLDDLENIVVVCKDCHNEIEPMGFVTRGETLNYTPRRRINLAQEANPTRQTEFDLTPAEKAANTKAANVRDELRRDADLAEWALPFARYLDADPGILPLSAPRVSRPEKDWHVIVYGAGRHARVSREAS